MEFLQEENKTASSKIYIEISQKKNEKTSLWLGKIWLMQFTSMHEEVWAFLMLYHVFRVFFNQEHGNLIRLLNH